MLKLRPMPVLLLIASLLLAACASSPDIRTDYDPNANLAQYKTYNFFDPLGIDNPGYSSIYGSIFKNAISRELIARGFVKSDNPDVLFNVSAMLQDKTEVSTYSNPAPVGYYGYRRGFYGAWGGYGYSTSTHVDQYTEGTFNIDMVDVAAKRMLWEGVAVGRVKEERTNEELTQNINEAVAMMFAEFPFTVRSQ
jgi:hypothetical protein